VINIIKMAPTVNRMVVSLPSDFLPVLPKISDADPDIRFMTLVDMCTMLTVSPQNLFQNDNTVSSRIVDAVVQSLDDSNGDVQSQALKTVEPLAGRLTPDILKHLLDNLMVNASKKSLERSIYTTAARTTVMNLPPATPGTLTQKEVIMAADSMTRVLIPRLLGFAPSGIPKSFAGSGKGLLDIDPKAGANPEAVDLCQEMLRCYGPLLQDIDKRALMQRLMEILDDDGTTQLSQKKTIAALAAVATHLTTHTLEDDFYPGIVARLQQNPAPAKLRLLIVLIGSLARNTSKQLGHHLELFVPFVLVQLSQSGLDALMGQLHEEGSVDSSQEEVKEAALTTLDEMITCCGDQMRKSTEEVIACATRFLAYDPAVVNADEDQEMEEDGGDDFGAEDEDFEEEAAMSDTDDSSWKIRRCAAKVLHTIIATRSQDLLENGVLYEAIAPVLIRRFTEREESVRLEILYALALLIKKTRDTRGAMASTAEEGQQPRPSTSRKRRRSGSFSNAVRTAGSMKGAISPGQSPPPDSGPRAQLGRLSASIVQGIVRSFSQPSIPTKQAATMLLKDFVNVGNAGLTEHLEEIIKPTIVVVKQPNTGTGSASTQSIGGAASATGSTLRIESLQLISAICDSHSSKSLTPYIGDMAQAVIAAIKDSHFKIAGEAIETSQSVIKVLTPPRSLGVSGRGQGNLESIFDVLVQKAQGQGTELEVRQGALHAIGVILARSAGHAKLLSASKRTEATAILQDRLKNETTRIAAIQAIDFIAASPFHKNEYPESWTRTILVELANQLRKANRTLRASSLATLQHLLDKDAVRASLDPATLKELASLLRPLLVADNVSQLNLALDCLTDVIRQSKGSVVDVNMVAALCGLAKSPLSGPTLDAFLDLVDCIGKNGAGKQLMQDLLGKVGVSGPPDVVGPAIGTLLSSGSKLGVSVSDIETELKTAKDDNRRALALAVLGEVGLRMGSSSPIKPEVFLTCLDAKIEVARSAAVSLGRAGAGNVSVFLPVMLKSLQATGQKQQLLLHSVREILEHMDKGHSDISTQADELWQRLITISQSENNKAVGAECIGKMVSLEPKRYLSQLKVSPLISKPPPLTC